jgi:hypothetical protein
MHEFLQWTAMVICDVSLAVIVVGLVLDFLEG